MSEVMNLHEGANANTRQAFAHAAAVVAFYTLVFTLYFSPVLFSTRILAPGDGSNFHAPFFYAGRTLWQPLLWGGYPLAADPQTMTFYPVALIFSLVPHGYDAFVVSAYVLAASFAYGYAFRLTRSTFAALVGGLTYGMCGFLSAQLGHVSLVHTAAWAPALFWSLESLRRRASARSFAACAASVACCALAGHFQIFTYALGLALLYTLALSWTSKGADEDGERRRDAHAGLREMRNSSAVRSRISRDARARDFRSSLRRIALMLSSLALGVAASAVQLIPTYELTAQGQRARMSFAEFVSFSLPPRHLLRLFFPYAFGGSPGSFYAAPYFDAWGPPVGGWGATELAIYVGVLPLALSLIGLIAYRRSRVAWFWACAAMLALALSAGDALPLARLVFHLPAYDKFRVPARHLFELALATGALGSLGVAAIEREIARARLVRRAIILTGVALLLSLLALCLLTNALRDEATRAGVKSLSFAPWYNPATLAPIVVLIVGALALLIWSRRATSHMRRALVVVALALDLASFGWFYEWRFTSPEAATLAPPATAARYSQILRDTHQRLLPARGVLTTRDGSPPNVSALWRVPSASGYSALILARIARLLDMTNDGGVQSDWRDTDDRSLDLFAVRYVATARETNEARAATTNDHPPPSSTTNDHPPQSSAANYHSSNLSTSEDIARVGSQGVEWSASDLGVALGKGCDGARPDAAEFTLPAPTRADSVALVSALACSAAIKDGTPVLRVTATDDQGDTQSLTVRAGADTSEWAHDCADVLPSIAHARAPVFESYAVERAGRTCEGHSYVARLAFPRELTIKTLRLEWIGGAGSADVKKLSLLDESTARDANTPRTTPVVSSERALDPARWRHVEDAGGVSIYENLRAQPRAWLVRNVVTLSADDALRAIKTARLPDGRAFDPAQTALVEEPITFATNSAVNNAGDKSGVASIVRESDTSVSLRVSANADALLVLGDVNYPGWRARVDGRDARVYQTDYALRGVRVPAGEHAVEFTYEPRSLRVGALLSVFSLIVIALVALLLSRRAERKADRLDEVVS